MKITSVASLDDTVAGLGLTIDETGLGSFEVIE
jgi:hypothetical protein